MNERTEKILEEINALLDVMCPSVKVITKDGFFYFALKDNKGIDSYIINLKDEIHECIKNVVKINGYEVRYNNMRSCFWLKEV